MKKESQTQEFLEAKVIHKMNGKIDLKELWKSEEDKELSPELVDKLVL
jgi:hypothetical protein